MSTALWVVFWVLAVLVGSLIFSLLLAAWIHAGSGEDTPPGPPERGPVDDGSQPRTGAESTEHEEPEV